jgi:hypothetical protein
LYVIYRALPGGSDLIILYYCLMAKWTGLGDNTELFWAVLSQEPASASHDKSPPLTSALTQTRGSGIATNTH